MSRELIVTRQELVDLHRRAPRNAVLSVYLDQAEPGKAALRRGQSALNAGLRELERAHPDDRALAAAAEGARRIYRKLPPEDRRRHLVLFLSLESDWLWWRSLQLPPGDRMVWMDRPYLRPLVALLDSAPPVGVVVVASGIVRLLTWSQGVVDEATPRKFVLADEDWRRYAGPAPAHPGMAQQTSTNVEKYEDRVEVHLRRFLAEVGGEVAEAGERERWRRVVLLGAPALTEALAASLPDPWRSRVLPGPALNLARAPAGAVADAVTGVVAGWVRARDREAVRELLDAVAVGGTAATGAQACLDLLRENRVSHLYLDDQLRLSGYRRPDGALIIADGPVPPGAAVERHLVERMIEMALDQGAAVTLVGGEAAERLRAAGGVGARLRY
ncbi:MAG: VLRF1 family aeRF1-type release factor [Armatimonadota bacterium]|nr:VLRF1 family aeRF1-type release factor [Armatimonadota bacterium]